jgi:hypothetical protein
MLHQWLHNLQSRQHSNSTVQSGTEWNHPMWQHDLWTQHILGLLAFPYWGRFPMLQNVMAALCPLHWVHIQQSYSICQNFFCQLRVVCCLVHWSFDIYSVTINTIISVTASIRGWKENTSWHYKLPAKLSWPFTTISHQINTFQCTF